MHIICLHYDLFSFNQVNKMNILHIYLYKKKINILTESIIMYLEKVDDLQ